MEDNIPWVVVMGAFCVIPYVVGFYNHNHVSYHVAVTNHLWVYAEYHLPWVEEVVVLEVEVVTSPYKIHANWIQILSFPLGQVVISSIVDLVPNKGHLHSQGSYKNRIYKL
jgi:hypothetical protein